MAWRIVIAGGGTGGHLYPGIALARELMERNRDIEITFVGTRQGIESRILPREGFALKIISAGGLVGKQGLERWSSWFKLPVGIAQSLDDVLGLQRLTGHPRLVSQWITLLPTADARPPGRPVGIADGVPATKPSLRRCSALSCEDGANTMKATTPTTMATLRCHRPGRWWLRVPGPG